MNTITLISIATAFILPFVLLMFLSPKPNKSISEIVDEMIEEEKKQNKYKAQKKYYQKNKEVILQKAKIKYNNKKQKTTN